MSKIKQLLNLINETTGGFGTDIRYKIGDKVKVKFQSGWKSGIVVNVAGPKYDTVMYDIKIGNKIEKGIAQYWMDHE